MPHRAPNPFDDTLPATGLHLLDASMFWGQVGGVRRVLTTKHSGFDGLGWRHTVLAPGAHGPGYVDCGGLPLPSSGGYRVLLGRRHAERLIERARPDVVEAADPYTLAWATLAACRRLQVPTVAFCHSDLPALVARLLGGRSALATRRGRWAARWARDYLSDLYARFDLVLAPSAAMAQRLRSWNVPRVAVQSLGVDCSVFHPGARDPVWRVRLCERLGLDPGGRLLVYTGRFAPEKNLQVLADAVRLLGPGHALLAVGTGPAPPRGEHVHLVEPERDSARLARLVASSDTYVHAGNQETFGLGVLEAMACGTPIVVSAGAGLGELAHDAGVAVPRLRAHEWAEAIHDSLHTGVSPRSQAALARARQHDWPLIIEQMANRYAALARRHSGQWHPAPRGSAPSRTPAATLP